MSEEKEQEAPEPLNVHSLIAFSLEQFVALAWQRMGLQPDVVTRKMEKDIQQAKVAIDIASQLAEALDPQLDDAERRRIQNLMTDLKINLVRQMQSDSTA